MIPDAGALCCHAAGDVVCVSGDGCFNLCDLVQQVCRLSQPQSPISLSRAGQVRLLEPALVHAYSTVVRFVRAHARGGGVQLPGRTVTN